MDLRLAPETVYGLLGSTMRGMHVTTGFALPGPAELVAAAGTNRLKEHKHSALDETFAALSVRVFAEFWPGFPVAQAIVCTAGTRGNRGVHVVRWFTASLSWGHVFNVSVRTR